MSEAPTAPKGEWPLMLSGLVALSGLAVMTFDSWRKGVLLFAGGILLAGLLRLMLSDEAAGLLHVRRRTFDTLALLGMGIAILLLGLIVPD
jgi:hypothetical protein